MFQLIIMRIKELAQAVYNKWFISDEGVYVDSTGKVTKNVVLQWGELPTSVGMAILYFYLPSFSCTLVFLYITYNSISSYLFQNVRICIS